MCEGKVITSKAPGLEEGKQIIPFKEISLQYFSYQN